MVFAIVLSSLALMAATVCMALTIHDRKRSDERNAAQSAKWAEALRRLQGQVEELTNGAVPDYEKARAAAKAVDDFYEGIANILNYDPYQMIQNGGDGGDSA